MLRCRMTWCIRFRAQIACWNITDIQYDIYLLIWSVMFKLFKLKFKKKQKEIWLELICKFETYRLCECQLVRVSLSLSTKFGFKSKIYRLVKTVHCLTFTQLCTTLWAFHIDRINFETNMFFFTLCLLEFIGFSEETRSRMH